MRVPLSWLREYVELPADRTAATSPTEADRRRPRGRDASSSSAPTSRAPWSSAGCSTIEELTGFKKPIRYCQVDVGQANGPASRRTSSAAPRNFAVGDQVVVVLPGGVLPGGFEIGARKTYGHISTA